jgi:hypothetical protein
MVTGREDNNCSNDPRAAEKAQGHVTWANPISGNKKSKRNNPSPGNGLE